MKTPASLLVLGALALTPVLSAAADALVPYKACPGAPSADDTEAAKGLYQAGKTSYNEADYQTAIRYWRDAFDRDCTAVAMLLNLANAYEKAGNIDAAIGSLETYLKRKPSADDASTIQKRIENMKKTRAAAPPATTAAPPATAKPSATPPPTATTPPTANPADGGKGPGIAPWIVVGAGGALLIVGGVLYLGGASKVSDADQACPARVNCAQSIKDKGNSGRSGEKVGSIVSIVGVAGIAGGLAWYFLAQPKDSSAKALVMPEAAPGYAGLSAVGRF